MIYEIVVIEDGPLLINCPCNSSYRGRHALELEDEEPWRTGAKLPPLQPPLSLTCRFTRRETLAIFVSIF